MNLSYLLGYIVTSIIIFYVIFSLISFDNASDAVLGVPEHKASDYFDKNWFEVARTPNRFQRDGHRAVARYTLVKNGYKKSFLHFATKNEPLFHVDNTSIPYPVNSTEKLKTAHGLAWAKQGTSGHFIVSFFPGIYGTYRIIYRSKTVSVVSGGTNSDMLWVLQTDSHVMSPQTKHEILTVLAQYNAQFPVDQLRWHSEQEEINTM